MDKKSGLSLRWSQKTKIVCTLGPGVNNQETIESLIKAGMNVARINLSHGTLKEHACYIGMVRDIAEKLGKGVAVLADLPGPKYRTGEMKHNSALLKKDAEVTLTNRQVCGDENYISINFPTLARDVKAGSKILVDDGNIQLKVKEVRGEEVICTVTAGGIVTQGRGVVVPGAAVSGPFITERMKTNLDFVVEQLPDFIALSFVTHPENILSVREILTKKEIDIPVICKIEREEAVKNFDKILSISDGIMVARGDLGVEIELQRVPMVQKDIILKCNRAGKPVITATQMLESMVNSPRPTRAEVTDVANAILDGTDAIMLSAETSIGKYPVQAVQMMRKIAEETEKHLPFEQMLLQRGQYLENKADELISYNAVYSALKLKAKAVVAFTQSGTTARRVSKYRPSVPIIAITPVQETAGRLILSWGVHSFQIASPSSVDDLFAVGTNLALKLGLVKKGDLIVITGGVPIGVARSTNLLKIQKVE
ncbi:MAG TPA: pyruvate kinase [Dehalococcoidales bacterium]|nr:pyruvate kinase [Dehalococcoidales bacterium]